MDVTATAPFLYPLQCCKILHLVRHAQGLHNAAAARDYASLSSTEYFDASLSPLGWQQVRDLRKQIRESGLLQRLDLVITSPLLRAMQTAVGVFGNEEQVHVLDAPELKEENIESPTLKCPPILAIELCRERVGPHPCDKREAISKRRPLFPAIDFSLIESDEDNTWTGVVRETDEELAARGLKFMNWLWTRQEKEIAVVTHHRFLQHTLNNLANDCESSVETEIRNEFGNCELRSLVIVNKSSANVSLS
ncbi:hypothetical protein K2173_007974 [Erythroxylum novogranatense]|uniref:Phosphoglycerate mutase-like protein n=1 Tax=Erythroxylum novogranatense TaxID=1862640 RepID=A0AAV8T6Z6_9ROSI|nr:hypothetical protein K2173_007974 [Erythroxylum novogranatense]